MFMWLRRLTLCKLNWCSGYIDRDDQQLLCFRCGTCGKISYNLTRSRRIDWNKV